MIRRSSAITDVYMARVEGLFNQITTSRFSEPIVAIDFSCLRSATIDTVTHAVTETSIWKPKTGLPLSLALPQHRNMCFMRLPFILLLSPIAVGVTRGSRETFTTRYRLAFYQYIRFRSPTRVLITFDHFFYLGAI